MRYAQKNEKSRIKWTQLDEKILSRLNVRHSTFPA